jgi:hypothetical protein
MLVLVLVLVLELELVLGAGCWLLHGVRETREVEVACFQCRDDNCTTRFRTSQPDRLTNHFQVVQQEEW